MRFAKIYSSINYLLSNNFLNQRVSDKLYACHYLLSSYFIAKNDVFLNTALDLLKETLKYGYLNRDKRKGEFIFILKYTLSVTNSFGIDLDIEDLISDLGGPNNGHQLYNDFNLDLLDCDDSRVLYYLKNDFMYLIVLFKLRNETINKENCKVYINYFYSQYQSAKKRETLFCVFMVSFFLIKKM